MMNIPKWQQEFEKECLRLQRNDRALTDMRAPFGIFHWGIPRGASPSTFQLLGESLVGNTTLRSLYLTDAVLNEEVAEVLGKGIGHSGLESVTLQYLSMQDVPQVLFEGMGSTRTLQKVAFHGDGQFAKYASDILIRVPTLKILELKMFRSIRNGMDELSNALRNNTSLTTLELSNCGMNDSWVELLVESLHPDLPIRRLLLQRNLISPIGLRSLLRAVKEHPTLQELNLKQNCPSFGYEGLNILGEELASTNQLHLTCVDVSSCARWSHYTVPSSRIAEEQEKARHKAGENLLSGVKKNHYIKELSNSENAFSEDLVNDIHFYTQLNKMGRYLLSTDHRLPDTVWCRILAKCQRESANTSSLMYFFLREQPHLMRDAI